MNFRFRIMSSAVLLVGTAIAAPLFVYAQTASPSPSAAPSADNCAITQDDVQAINDASLVSLNAELAARKDLLTRVIDCAEMNVAALQSDLSKVQVSSSTATLKSQLNDKLDEANSYYDLELQKLQGVGISGTKAIANEVLSWRSGTYDPLAQEVANFVIWSENQGLFSAAQTRLGQIGKIVSFIETTSPNTGLSQDLAGAQALITTANAENNDALGALMQSAQSDETLALITSSLQSLSDAYQKFSDISTIVQGMVSVSASSGQ